MLYGEGYRKFGMSERNRKFAKLLTRDRCTKLFREAGGDG